MKKAILLIVFFFNLIPLLENGKVVFCGPQKSFAQYNGGSEQNEDQCDESSPSYDPSVCEQATCDPGSVNYNVDECDMQACDESSTNYDPSQCEYSTCDPDNINYDVDQCDMQDCDESSVNYNPSQCEYDTCAPDNVNYDVDQCDMQNCDESSVNYDPSQCEYDTCAPDNVNYDVDECDMQDCDESSVNYNASQCEYDTCDPDNVNYDIDECDMQVCDDTSVNFDASGCEYATCDPDNINYNKRECELQKCDPTSVNYDSVECVKERCDPTSANYDILQCPSCNVSAPKVTATKVPPTEKHELTYLRDHGTSALGATAPESIKLTIGACLDGTNWKGVLKIVTGEYSEEYNLWDGTEVTGVGSGGNTTQSNFCQQLTDLNALGKTYSSSRTPPVWYMVSAVGAHEDVHSSHFQPALNDALADIRSLVENCTVANTGQTEAEAVAQIQSTYTDLETDALSLWKSSYVALTQNDDSVDCPIAEHTVVDPVIAAICAYAAAHSWGTCSTFTCP